MYRRAGRPSCQPRRVTVTLTPQNAETLERFAAEAGVSMSAYCGHQLERCAMQDYELLANDAAVLKLREVQQEFLEDFRSLYGELLLRQAHEVTALRTQVTEYAAQAGNAQAMAVKEAAWQQARTKLRAVTTRLRGTNETQ